MRWMRQWTARAARSAVRTVRGLGALRRSVLQRGAARDRYDGVRYKSLIYHLCKVLARRRRTYYDCPPQVQVLRAALAARKTCLTVVLDFEGRVVQ